MNLLAWFMILINRVLTLTCLSVEIHDNTIVGRSAFWPWLQLAGECGVWSSLDLLSWSFTLHGSIC